MTTRKELRDTIGAAIGDDNPLLTVFTGKVIFKAVDVVPVVIVNIGTGALEHDLASNAQGRADVFIAFIVDGDHDAVDLVADRGMDALFDSATFAGIVQSALMQGYEYLDDYESGLTTFIARVSVGYIA